MEPELIVYGHEFCADATFLQSTLKRNAISFEWRDIAEGSPGFRVELRLLARGYLSVPTVIFPDGSVMVEPNPGEVLAKLRAGPGPAKA